MESDNEKRQKVLKEVQSIWNADMEAPEKWVRLALKGYASAKKPSQDDTRDMVLLGLGLAIGRTVENLHSSKVAVCSRTVAINMVWLARQTTGKLMSLWY